MIKNAKNDAEVEAASSPTPPTVPKPTGAFARWPETANEAGESMETTKKIEVEKFKPHPLAVVEMVKPVKRKLTAVELAWGAARGYKWAQQTMHQDEAGEAAKGEVCEGLDGANGAAKVHPAAKDGENHQEGRDEEHREEGEGWRGEEQREEHGGDGEKNWYGEHGEEQGWNGEYGEIPNKEWGWEEQPDGWYGEYGDEQNAHGTGGEEQQEAQGDEEEPAPGDGWDEAQGDGYGEAQGDGYGEGEGDGWDEEEHAPNAEEGGESETTKTNESWEPELDITLNPATIAVDIRGCPLPRYVDSLPSFMYGMDLKTRDAIFTYFMECVELESYVAAIMGQIKAHKMLKFFEAYINEKYEMFGWTINTDEDHEEFLHSISDFVHFLMLQPTTSPMTLAEIFDQKHPEKMEEQMETEEEQDGEEKAKEEEKAKQDHEEKQDCKEKAKEEEKARQVCEEEAKLEKAKKDQENAKKKEKAKQGAAEKTSKEGVNKADKDKVPHVRHREKGPAKTTQTQDVGYEAWTVTWGPVTKKGVVDFVSNCSGQPISTWEPNTFKPDTITTSGKSIGNTVNHSIRWQPIKPGETVYILGRFFCQVEPKNMTLQQLIRYCKGIDWNLLHPIPATTPSFVRDTINAICSMWDEYKTDRPDEIQWWLSQWCAPQKTCSPEKKYGYQDRFLLPRIWETF